MASCIGGLELASRLAVEVPLPEAVETLASKSEALSQWVDSALTWMREHGASLDTGRLYSRLKAADTTLRVALSTLQRARREPVAKVRNDPPGWGVEPQDALEQLPPGVWHPVYAVPPDTVPRQEYEALQRERDLLHDKLRQFEAYGIDNVASVLNEREALRSDLAFAACEYHRSQRHVGLWIDGTCQHEVCSRCRATLEARDAR
jgi:hypothetical protein